MEITPIRQEDNTFLHTVKTVEWLVNNTTVSVFNPIEFTGYQREISDAHCAKIVNYLNSKFYLPTPIICACDYEYKDADSLRIVDGQHRVQAFRKLKEQNETRYNEIKDYQISVIVMEKVDIRLEIDTFITINKTSKRVDTSLAYVLKNKLNIEKNSADLNISKLDYIAVELAVLMNERNPLWKNKISFTESPKQSGPEVISLNAFVKATRRLIGQLEKKGIIEIKWENESEINECIELVEGKIGNLWKFIMGKWGNSIESNESNLKILQGPIGYSSITRFISNEIKDLGDDKLEGISGSAIDMMIFNWINSINLSEDVWYPGNKFSKLTSESGYNIIAAELKKSMKK